MKNNSKEVVLEFNLPEFSKEDVRVNLSPKAVVIKAERKTKKKVQREDFFHKEKSYRRFSYTTTLPAVEPKKAKISFKKGILKIIAPKK
jgi:HSP20 family protein